MLFYVPEIGDSITLSRPWTFNLHRERRNDDLISALALEDGSEWKEARARQEELFAKAYRWETRTRGIETYYGRGLYDYQYRERVILDEAAHNELAGLSDRLLKWTWPITLPVNTVLKVDRIYIRKGASEFSSITFNINSCPLPELTLAKEGGKLKRGARRRFWAKLSDINGLEYEQGTVLVLNAA